MSNGGSTSFRNSWLIAIALTGWLLWLLAPVLTPFIAAALLAYIGDPLVAVPLITIALLLIYSLVLVRPLKRSVGAVFEAAADRASGV